MKFLLLLSSAALFLAVLGAPYNDAALTEWEQYKVAHNKFYRTAEEEARRLETFLANKQMIDEHNRKHERGETNFKMAVNEFADWFPEELDRLNGLKVDKSERRGRPFKPNPATPLPKSINWVEKGAVTSVKDQGNCGSCYAFSAVGALEGLMFRTNNSITSLSVQELVDCSGNSGCNGGRIQVCFSYVKQRGGIDDDASYPYIGKAQEKCSADKGVIAASCTGRVDLEGEDELLNAVGTVGPVSITFGVSKNFQFYHSGVYDGTCALFSNHAMLVVGYGTDNETGKDYWLVKNSWGAKWGEKGYVRVIRNVTKCNLGRVSFYPTYD